LAGRTCNIDDNDFIAIDKQQDITLLYKLKLTTTKCNLKLKEMLAQQAYLCTNNPTLTSENAPA